MFEAILIALVIALMFCLASVTGFSLREHNRLEDKLTDVERDRDRLQGVMERAGLLINPAAAIPPDESLDGSWTGEESPYDPEAPKGSSQRWDEGRPK